MATAKLIITNEGKLSIALFRVHPGFMGEGIGTQLLSVVMEEAERLENPWSEMNLPIKEGQDPEIVAKLFRHFFDKVVYNERVITITQPKEIFVS